MWIKRILDKIKNNNLVVYTAIIGDYDTLVDPLYIDKNCDYICFTDNHTITSKIWNVIYIDKDKRYTPVKNARKYKILVHRYLPQYQHSVWVDASYNIVGSIRQYIDKYSKSNSILCMVHPHRDCIYEEAQACIDMNKDDKHIIDSQMEKYRLKLYPEHNGLIASGMLYRKHTDESLFRIMEEWWKEVKEYSCRDQLSFNYICNKYNFTYDKSNINCFENEYVNIREHKL
ncbi:glycosyltransferase domain-containing protein [uncultured Clostridium sp.]|uniref:glycosyltransferase domain-containing protein n=1 Tax=uncultured Clostridium sp. TaxID=59620 RepID=UPI0028F050E2|nr:glycosyltransferase domain-containing protein [uncultured Clostridium sp.]